MQLRIACCFFISVCICLPFGVGHCVIVSFCVGLCVYCSGVQHASLCRHVLPSRYARTQHHFGCRVFARVETSGQARGTADVVAMHHFADAYCLYDTRTQHQFGIRSFASVKTSGQERGTGKVSARHEWAQHWIASVVVPLSVSACAPFVSNDGIIRMVSISVVCDWHYCSCPVLIINVVKVVIALHECF